MVTAAAVYCRLSRPDSTREESLGIDRQRTFCLQLADRLGWPVADILTDDGVSAWDTRKTRPAYKRMLAGIADGTYDAIVVYDHYRLHRQNRELEDFFTACDKAGVTAMASYSGDIDLSSPDGRFQLRILGAVATKESDDKSRRIKAKLAQAAADGRSHGGRRPYGYRKGGMQVDQAEAERVRHFAAQVVAGASLNAVAREANGNGWPSSSGLEWTTRSLRKLLLSHRIVGKRTVHGEVVADARWPAILDDVTWLHVRAVLDDPSRQRPGGQTMHLLSGIVVCGLCGQVMRSGYRKGGVRRYACVKRPGWQGCGRMAIAAEPLDDLVADQVSAALESTNLQPPDGPDESALLGEIAVCEAKQRELAECWADDGLSRAEWLAARNALQSRVDAARRQLVRAVSTVDVSDARWDGMALEGRRVIIGALIERVEVAPTQRRRFDPDRVHVVWR